MQARYTTKKYDPSKKIDAEKLDALKEILRLSPSSLNSQPWQFTFVTDQNMRDKLALASQHNDSKVKNCDTVIVLSRIDNLTLFEQQLTESPHPIALSYYNEHLKLRPEAEVKAWFERQVYLALGVLLSACAEMQIDSTPMEGIEPDKYDEILGMTDYKTLVAVAVGHRDAEDKNQLQLKAKWRREMSEVVKTV